MRRVGGHLSGQQVARDDPAGPVVLEDHVEQFRTGVQLDGASRHLAHEGRVGADEELLAGLTPGVERARDLCAAERTVVQEAAVVAGERNALGSGLVNDVDRDLGESMHVGLAGPVVATLDGVVEEPVDRVAVVRVVLRSVDAALGGDAVGPARAVVEGEGLHAVAQFSERGGG